MVGVDHGTYGEPLIGPFLTHYIRVHVCAMCMYVHVCMCVCVWVHMYVFMCMGACVHVYRERDIRKIKH